MCVWRKGEKENVCARGKLSYFKLIFSNLNALHGNVHNITHIWKSLDFMHNSMLSTEVKVSLLLLKRDDDDDDTPTVSSSACKHHFNGDCFLPSFLACRKQKSISVALPPFLMLPIIQAKCYPPTFSNTVSYLISTINIVSICSMSMLK